VTLLRTARQKRDSHTNAAIYWLAGLLECHSIAEWLYRCNIATLGKTSKAGTGPTNVQLCKILGYHGREYLADGYRYSGGSCCLHLHVRRERSFMLKTEASGFSETYLPDHTKSHHSSNGPNSLEHESCYYMEAT
jgi:hypothetical protein